MGISKSGMILKLNGYKGDSMSIKDKAEWCVNWLEGNGVICEMKEDFSVVIYLEGGFNMEITDAEVHYRATLWAEHILSEEL